MTHEKKEGVLFDHPAFQLHRTVETLKLSTKKLNELERDLTEMEGTNDRLDRENRSLQKEVRWRQALSFS